MIKLELSVSGAKTLVRVLDHVIHQASNTGESGYAIDLLCRKDGAARWRELRNYINMKLPKKVRLP